MNDLLEELEVEIGMVVNKGTREALVQAHKDLVEEVDLDRLHSLWAAVDLVEHEERRSNLDRIHAGLAEEYKLEMEDEEGEEYDDDEDEDYDDELLAEEDEDYDDELLAEEAEAEDEEDDDD